MTLLLVALGAALAAPLRYVVCQLFDGYYIPWGTIAVNVVASFLAGVFAGLSLDRHLLALLAAGFCGSLSTYSTFAVQTYHGGARNGTWNVVLTLVPAVLLCSLGFWWAAAGAGQA